MIELHRPTPSRAVTDAMIEHLCGDFLGYGIARHVFVYGPDPTKVIKLEEPNGWHQNVLENEAWEQVQFTKWAKWFAPVHYISNCGRLLIQSRTTPLTSMPRQIPNFLTDLKPDNLGMIGRRVVPEWPS